MNGNYTCGVCGKTITGLDAYLAHVTECGKKMKAAKAEEEKKYLEEVNAALRKVKSAKTYYEECLRHFKEKYPKEYALNFGTYQTKSKNAPKSNQKSNVTTDANSSEKKIDAKNAKNTNEYTTTDFLKDLAFLFGAM